MSLINFEHNDCNYYIVNGYWCAHDWFINCTDEELIIGVLIKRAGTLDGTIWTRVRRVLRTLGIKGSVPKNIYRDSGMFREIEEGRRWIYSSLPAGICNLTLDGPISVDLNKYIDHGQVIKGIADLENQTLWNRRKRT